MSIAISEKQKKRNEEVKLFFNRLAQGWDEGTNHSGEVIDKILELAGVKAGMRALDVACGTGVLTRRLLDLGCAEITGIDISEEMIKRARLKFSEERCEFIAQDAFAFNKGGYDIAIIYSAYPHFADKAALSAHIAQLLADGGRFVVAHSQSKEKINHRHEGGAAGVSDGLRDVKTEAEEWKKEFDIDVMIDNDEMYVLSGVLRHKAD